MPLLSLEPEDYTVGWICVIDAEFIAAIAMLDKRHAPISLPNDPNRYQLGEIAGHNVAIACLNEAGTNEAASVAGQLKSSFKNVRFGLMVGIGGGVPSSDNDIRLGDIVVGMPTGDSGGTVQYDRGKQTPGGVLVHKGHLNRPPQVLENAVKYLQAIGDVDVDDTFMIYLTEMGNKNNKLKKYTTRDGLADILYKPRARSQEAGDDSEQEIIRGRRDDGNTPVVHYGLIASGNKVMKDGIERDRLAEENGGAICFEMEGAGLANRFPSLNIRGISDYADSHKNDQWQPYAAAVAAAYAKSLLVNIAPQAVEKAKTISDSTTDGITPSGMTKTGGVTFNNYGEVQNQAAEQHITGNLTFS